MAGDIAVSAEIAAVYARRLGHSLADELKVLILHGLLHLAGYDHETDDGEMEQEEARLRSELRLPPSLIQRARLWPSHNLKSTESCEKRRRNTRQAGGLAFTPLPGAHKLPGAASVRRRR